MQDNQKRQFLEALKHAGVRFDVGNVGGGSLFVEPAELMQYIKNRNEFWADYYGVSVDKIIQFEQHVENQQCTAITAKQKQCLYKSDFDWDIRTFEYGVSTLCARHKRDFLATEQC